MRIQFFGPFENMAESDVWLEIQEPLNLAGVLGILKKRYKGLERWADKTSDAELSAHVMFLRNGKPLKLQDNVSNKDHIQVLLPVTGG